MSDVVKWGLLVVGIVAIIAMILAFGFLEYINVSLVIEGIETLLYYSGSALKSARGLINNFFFPPAYPIVSFAIYWILIKPFATISVKVLVSIYHYIFK